MNLLRLLVIAAVILIGYRLISSALERRRLERTRRDGGDSGDNGRSVRCARCGLNLPEAEALQHDGRFYCCAEHRDQGDA